MNVGIPGMGGMQRSLRDAHAHNVKATERIATGKSVNSAKDNAAAFTVSSNLDTYSRSRRMLARGLSSQLQVAQIADNGLQEVSTQLKRAKELAIQARSQTLSADERAYAQSQFNATLEEIDRLAQTTKYEDEYLLRFRGIDVGFVVDRSSSMDDPASDVKNSVAAFQQIFADGKLDAHMGVAHYYEAGEPGALDNDDGVERYLDIGSADVEPALKIIEDDRHGGFVDPYSALLQASGVDDIDGAGDPATDDTFSWREGTLKRVMILVTDTNNETNYHDPAQTETSTAAAMAASGITVHTITNSTVPYDEITTATGGSQGALSDLADPNDPDNPLTGTNGIAQQLVTELQNQSGGGARQVGIFEGDDHVIATPLPIDVTPAVLGLDGSDIATTASAGDALARVDVAMDTVNEYRSDIGAFQNRVESIMNTNLETSEIEATAAAEMVDADIAEEMALKLKSSVKADAASMMMMQAQRLQRGSIQQLVG